MIFIPIENFFVKDVVHGSILNIKPKLMRKAVEEVAEYLNDRRPFSYYPAYSDRLLKIVSIIYHILHHKAMIDHSVNDDTKFDTTFWHAFIFNLPIDDQKWLLFNNEPKQLFGSSSRLIKLFQNASFLYLLYTGPNEQIRIQVPIDELIKLIDLWDLYLPKNRLVKKLNEF